MNHTARDAGANVKVVQRLLGHKTATLTLDRCDHLFPTISTPWPKLSTVKFRYPLDRRVPVGALQGNRSRKGVLRWFPASLR
jgi:hypothetical protein